MYLLLVKQMLITGEMTAISDFLRKQHSIPLEDIGKATISVSNYGTCKSFAYHRPSNATEGRRNCQIPLNRNFKVMSWCE